MIPRISWVTLSDGSHHWMIRIPRWYLGWIYVTKPRLLKRWHRYFPPNPEGGK